MQTECDNQVTERDCQNWVTHHGGSHSSSPLIQIGAFEDGTEAERVAGWVGCKQHTCRLQLEGPGYAERSYSRWRGANPPVSRSNKPGGRTNSGREDQAERAPDSLQKTGKHFAHACCGSCSMFRPRLTTENWQTFCSGMLRFVFYVPAAMLALSP